MVIPSYSLDFWSKNFLVILSRIIIFPLCAPPLSGKLLYMNWTCLIVLSVSPLLFNGMYASFFFTLCLNFNPSTLVGYFFLIFEMCVCHVSLIINCFPVNQLYYEDANSMIYSNKTAKSLQRSYESYMYSVQGNTMFCRSWCVEYIPYGVRACIW